MKLRCPVPGWNFTRTPAATTVVCVDELGPLIPCAYPPGPGWTADGNRVKEEVAYWREPEKLGSTAGCAYGTARPSRCARTGVTVFATKTF
jgi:hypothetical protein